MTQAIRDENHVTVALGVSSASATTPLPFTIDSATGRLLTTAAGGTGDVVGPASATDNAVARFDSTTGKLIQNSVVTIADTTGVIAGTEGVTISGTTSGTTSVVATATAGTTTVTLPAVTDTLVGKATTDTLTNKTFDADGTGNSITNIENADIKAAAGIAVSKLAALTASEIVISDASGFISSGAVATYPSLTELTYLKGVTSAIQTQLNNKITNDSAAVGYADLDTNLIFPAYYSWVGSSESSTSAVLTSDGATVTITVQKTGGGDLILNFSTGFVTVDCTPALTLALTAGSDASPTLNYVYIRAAAPTVLTGSTTGFPAEEEYFPIGTYLVQSAATAQTYGIYKAHNWTDHIKATDNNGHISHINEWIRRQPATYESGIALTPTLTAASPDTLTIATTEGVILQLHDHTQPAFNSATAGTTAATTFFVVNNNAGAYTPGKDLYNFLLDSAGNATTNNDRISWVIWGVASQEDADCKIMVNLPSGFYNSDAGAIADDSRYANYNIPDEYTGAGFLIAKLTYKYSTTGGGDLTLVEQVDLRGQFPSIFAGGTAAVGTTFADNAFQVYDEVDSTKIIAFQASGITTGNTRTFTAPDASGTLALGTGTANEIAYWSGTNTLGTLAVATYPSLTELSYVKGLTSSAQTQITARLPLTGGTMTGSITLGENTSIALDPAGSADGKYTGTTVTGTGGATIAFGELVYLSSVDSRWELADADAVATADRMMGMAVTTSTDGNPITVLLMGIIRADSLFPALTIGSAVYAGETPGTIQVAIPTGADAVIRRVGYAMTADEIYFNPSMDSQTVVA